MTAHSPFPATDDELVETALTREEVMRARYGDTTNNGHVVDAPAPVTPLAVVTDEPTRVCVVCQEVIPPDRARKYAKAVTCGESCSRELERRRQAARNKTRTHRGKVTAVVSNGASPRLAPTASRLVVLITELVGAGLSVSVELEDTRVLVTG